MQEFAVGLGLVNVGVFTAVGVWAALNARRERSPRLRWISWLIVVICGAMLLGSAQRLALLARDAGLLPDSWQRVLLADWQVVKSLVTLLLAATGVVLMRRTSHAIRRMERVTSLLAGGEDAPTGSLTSCGLSPRELDVLELIGLGKVTDEQIATALHISPATAKTTCATSWRRPAPGPATGSCCSRTPPIAALRRARSGSADEPDGHGNRGPDVDPRHRRHQLALMGSSTTATHL